MLSSFTLRAFDNCRIGLKIINKQELQSLKIGIGTESLIYNSEIFEDDSICLSVENPYQMMVILNNELKNFKQIFIHKGNYAIIIDAAAKTIAFENSELNNDLANTNRIYDSISQTLNLHRIVDVEYRFFLDSTNNWNSFRQKAKIRDSIYEKVVYDYYLTHTTSYLSLSYVYYTSFCSQDAATKDKLCKLYYKLSPKLAEYSIYNEADKLLDKEIPETIQPLWNGK